MRYGKQLFFFFFFAQVFASEVIRQVVDGREKVTQTTTDTRGRVVEEMVLEGNAVFSEKSLRYDSHGNVIYEGVKGANTPLSITSRTFSDDNLLLEEVSPCGVITRYTYVPKTSLVKTVKVIDQMRIWQRTVYEYDEKGRLVRKTIDDGSAEDIGSSYNMSEKEVVEWQRTEKAPFLPLRREKKRLFEGELVTVGCSEYEYDGRGNLVFKKKNGKTVLQKTYDDRGLVVYTSEGGGTHTQYDKKGRPIQVASPAGSEVYVYDAHGNVVEVRKKGNVEYREYDKESRLVRIVNPTGVTEWDYDPFTGKPACVRAPDGKEEKWKYDFCGGCIEHTDTEGRTIKNRCDLFGRIVESTFPDGASEKRSYTLDGRLESITDPDGLKTAFEYDPLGHKVREAFSKKERFLGEIVYRYHGGNLVEMVDLDEIKTTWRYDAHGNRVQEKRAGRIVHPVSPKKEPPPPPTRTVTPVYDGSSKLYDIVTEYRTSLRGQVTEIIEQGAVTKFTYTPGGKLASKTLPDKTVLLYTYDDFGHLRTKKSSDGTIDQEFVHSKTGRLLSATDNVHKCTVKRTYDAWGNLLIETQGGGKTIEKRYDEEGRLTTLVFPDNLVTSYTYADARVNRIEVFLGKKSMYVETRDVFDAEGRLLEKTVPQGKIRYSYTDGGKLQSVSGPGFSETYGYDANARLINMNGAPWKYDMYGSVISDAVRTYKFDSLRQRVGREKELGMYNPSGHRVVKGEGENRTLYTYDAEGKLLFVRSPKAEISFAYDALGRRLCKMSGRQREGYLYDGVREVQSRSHRGDITLLCDPAGAPFAVQCGLQVLTAFIDPFGSIKCLINGEGRVTHSYDYTAYGRAFSVSETAFNPFRFEAKPFDPELELIYRDGNYFDPDTVELLSHFSGEI
ncbi:MAG: hypothetical protein A3F09_05920 [Chlamydiae bacterium RIFCSPHIGHO2_12_FULL_49_11]|nr:MAG: hypothetical protein A3F09_05920 [Chlamydiae bacterium RIFCSPHIGHO2_12_FULL_49_11]